MEELNVKAPSMPQAMAKIKDLMGENPTQATQIMTALGVVKHAKEGSYDQYCLMATSLNIEPADESRWKAHDKTVLRELIAASLATNLPGNKLTAKDIDDLLIASDNPNKLQAVKGMLSIIVRGLGASDDVAASWVNLGMAALNLAT